MTQRDVVVSTIAAALGCLAVITGVADWFFNLF